jgi:hypothetical protein
VKQAKNQKIGPQDWYSGYRAGSYFVTSLIQQNLLPTRRIQINFTLPNSNDNLMEYQQIGEKVVKIHIGVKELSYLLPEAIAKLLEEYYKRYEPETKQTPK